MVKARLIVLSKMFYKETDEEHTMTNTEILDYLKEHKVITNERSAKKPEGFDLDDYSRQIFEMYDGPQTEVKLEVRNDFAKYVVDRFGTDLKTTPERG